MRYVTHDVLVPEETVRLSPFGMWRDPGGICDSPKSAIRTLQIMELMANAEQPLRAIDVVRALDLSPSSCNQLLKSMMDWGYVIFDKTSKLYYPSLRLAKLGIRISRNYFGPELLDRLMQEVQDRLGVSVAISASQGTFMQVLDLLLLPDGHKAVIDERASVSAIGLQVPLIGSCTGAAWLSAQSDETIRTAFRLCRRDLSWQQCEADTLMERLVEIRKRGYAFGGMSIEDDVRSIALPLPPAANGSILVMCLTAEKQEIEAHKEEMARTASELAKLYLTSTGPTRS